jgi:ribokinase
MKILDYGSLNIDLVFSVDHIVRPGETISSGGLVKSAGGKGANQSAALAKAGLQVFIAGKIGQDGLFLLELLRSYGVDTSLVKVDDEPTGQALIQVDKNGQNSIVLYGGGNQRITIEEIQAALANFDKGDALLLQNEIAHNREIMLLAKKRGLQIILNPSPFDEKIAELPLDAVDVFFVNEVEGAAMAGLPADTGFPEILEALTKRFPKAEIVLTAGKKGAYYGKGSGKEAARAFAPIVDAPVVDTTAAGDTFTGFFLAARSKGDSPAEALALASKASSITVSRPGAMQSIPLAEEVLVHR